MMKSSKKRVLCVDDSRDICRMLAVMLASFGLEVQASTTVSEAKRFIQLEAYDLYILDMRFADGEGAELCQWIRTHDPEATILFYTGTGTETARAAAMNAGAAAYFNKPFTENLLSAVETHLAAER